MTSGEMGIGWGALAPKQKRPPLTERPHVASRVHAGAWQQGGNCFPAPTISTLHGIKELVVGLGYLQLVIQKFHRSKLIHGVEYLAQDPHLLQIIRLH